MSSLLPVRRASAAFADYTLIPIPLLRRGTMTAGRDGDRSKHQRLDVQEMLSHVSAATVAPETKPHFSVTADPELQFNDAIV
jgi:hypothetical protein